MTEEQLKAMFYSQNLTPEQANRIEIIRTWFVELAKMLTELCSAGRELSIAMTSLQTASFYAVKAIALKAPKESTDE